MFWSSENNKGFAALLTVILILAVGLLIGMGISLTVWNEQKITRNAIKSAEAYYAAEAGIEDSAYRIKKNKKYQSVNSLSVNGNSAEINITTEENRKIIESKGIALQRIRKLKTILNIDVAKISFHYGAQTGEWGIDIQPNAKVNGNVYSNGSIRGAGNNSQITGDAWVAGTNSIDKTQIGVDTHANIILNSNIGRDAYYQIIENTAVNGAKYPNSPDPPAKDLPISYAQIQEWEKAAESGGVINNNYTPPNNSSLGPVKINGNLTFNHDTTITITGPVWVNGDIIGGNNITIKLQDGLSSGFPIIADNPIDQISSGKIKLDNNVITQDSAAGGLLLFVSTNKSLDIDQPAIWLYNNVNKDKAQSIIFSLQGVIKVENNVKFKEISGYGLYLKNNAEIVYEQGLINAQFSSGPSGGWKISEWKETE